MERTPIDLETDLERKPIEIKRFGRKINGWERKSIDLEKKSIDLEKI